MTDTEYNVSRWYVRKRWLVPNWWRRFPPEIVRLTRLLKCHLLGHVWGDWLIDDEDGPRQWVDDEYSYPLCARVSRDGEYGVRVCTLGCGALERRNQNFMQAL